MNIEEKDDAVKRLSESTAGAEREAVSHVMIARHTARTLLDYIAELEAKVEAAGYKELDNVSDLKVGDVVETMIDYAYHDKGSRGIVDRIDDTEYPFRIRFEGVQYPVGYKRHELRKV